MLQSCGRFKVRQAESSNDVASAPDASLRRNFQPSSKDASSRPKAHGAVLAPPERLPAAAGSAPTAGATMAAPATAVPSWRALRRDMPDVGCDTSIDSGSLFMPVLLKMLKCMTFRTLRARIYPLDLRQGATFSAMLVSAQLVAVEWVRHPRFDRQEPGRRRRSRQ